jgi:GxxExxY protein
VPVPVILDDLKLEVGFRADLIVEKKLVIELKSIEKIAPVHKKQLLTYLRLTNCRLGLLINFNTVLIKDGISRVVNGLPE